MPNAPGEGFVPIDLFDWTGGIRNKRVNPLATPMNAFVDGEDLDLVDGCLRTQRDDEALATSVGDEVVVLKEVRFPTQNVSYLIAHVTEDTGPGE